jgi:hypothetical protein
MHKVTWFGIAAVAAIALVWSISTLAKSKFVHSAEVAKASSPIAPHEIMVRHDKRPSDRVLEPSFLMVRSWPHLRAAKGSAMATVRRKDYAGNPAEFDRWLKANAVLGSLVAIAMLAMAVAGLSLGPTHEATEFSSVNMSSE